MRVPCRLWTLYSWRCSPRRCPAARSLGAGCAGLSMVPAPGTRRPGLNHHGPRPRLTRSSWTYSPRGIDVGNGIGPVARNRRARDRRARPFEPEIDVALWFDLMVNDVQIGRFVEIGRASCRERVESRV